MASYMMNEYNDLGMLVGYSLDPAIQQNKERVETMLALESNWATYEAGTQNTSPSFTNLGTGSRFRLLFGQNDPEEKRTNQSAKYVHTVAVTIDGTPTIKTDGLGLGIIKLSNKIGKHKTKFHVAADEAMLDLIMENIRWESSDDRVLRIDAVKMKKSQKYADAVQVTIEYEVLVEGGEASITGSMNGALSGVELSGSTIATADDAPADKPTNDDSDKDKDKDNPNSGGSDKNSNKIGKLSLTKDGTETAMAETYAPPQPKSGMLTAMDLEDIMVDNANPAQIKPTNDAKKYAPFIACGLGGMLALGGAAAAMSFKSETTGLWRTRKR